MHGFGIYTSGSINTAAGTSPMKRYEGGWEHDAPSGFGVQINMATGRDESGGSSFYEGEWVDGMQQGHGIELRPNGRRCALKIVVVTPHLEFSQFHLMIFNPSALIGTRENGCMVRSMVTGSRLRRRER